MSFVQQNDNWFCLLIYQYIIFIVLIDRGLINSFVLVVLFHDLDFELFSNISEVYFDGFDQHCFIKLDPNLNRFMNIHFTAPILVDIAIKYIVDSMFSIFECTIATNTNHIARIQIQFILSHVNTNVRVMNQTQLVIVAPLEILWSSQDLFLLFFR